MSDFSNCTIIVVDDNPSDAKVLQSLLKRLGVACQSFNSWNFRDGFAALEALPDAIFLDLEMPGTNGYEVLEEIQAEGSLDGIPIVAYSAHSSEMVNARQAGFHSFLGKPLESGEFADQLEQILNGNPVWSVR